MIDFEKLDDVMQFIEDNPEKHDQEVWGKQTECGTVACVAGWTVLKYAPELVWFYHFGMFKGHLYLAEDGVPDVAARILGLDIVRASILFEAENTVNDLKHMVKALHNDPNISADALFDSKGGHN